MSATPILGKLFWLCSRTALATYARFPLFGKLNAAIGVVHRENIFLIIDRNDGRGVSFPGGLQRPWETPKQALIREIREETGLDVTRSLFKFRYFSSVDIPVHVTVFEIEVQGELRQSWEGTPRWLPLVDVRRLIIESQRVVLEVL